MAKKIGNTEGNKAPKSGTEKASAPKRVDFKFKKDEHPFKVAVPEGYDFDAHKPLKRSDFAENYLFVEHQALALKHKAQKMLAQAEAKLERVETLKTLGDAKTRKEAQRALKLQDELAELEKALGGKVDLEKFRAMVQKEKGDAK